MKKQIPARERLIELFSYDPATGVVRRKIAAARMAAGSVVGDVTSTGYLRVSVDGSRYRLHRVIWKMVTGCDPLDIDHEDLDKMNNRWGNLREATKAQNSQNTSIRADNTSGFKGVCFHKRSGKWLARIYVNRRQTCLGLFDDAASGHSAYVAAAARSFGEFARSS
jgi:hypothetical protein